jgi:hypothetical protein
MLAASRIRARVAALTDAGRLNARDTVDFDTAAWVATSSIVAIQLPPKSRHDLIICLVAANI